MNRDITNILKRMDAILKPQRELQEKIGKMISPQLQFQKEIGRFLEPQLKLQRQMEKYLEPHRKLQEQMQRYLEPHYRLQEQMRKHIESHQKLQEQLVKYLEPQRKLQKQLGKYLEPHIKLQKKLKKHLEPYGVFHEQFDEYIQPLNRYLSDPLMGSVNIESDGSITVSGSVVDVDTIEKSLDGISGDYLTDKEFLKNLFQWLEKLGNTTRIAVIYLVLPYFLAIVANLTTPIYEEWWKEYAGSDHRVAKKEIIREANEIYNSDILGEYRFVYASVLHVREMGNMNSEIINELYFGKTVKIKSRSKRWSYIEYQDSDLGEIREGWVFSRYLQKFKK